MSKVNAVAEPMDLQRLFREREQLNAIKDSSLLDEVSRKRVIKRIAEINSLLGVAQGHLVVTG